MQLSSKQTGQSLVELGVLVSFVIAPLMLLLPYFAKLVEARHYNDMSARYIAFEKNVWLERAPANYRSSGNGSLAIKQTNTIAQEVPLRLFSSLDRPINSRIDPNLNWNTLDHGYTSFKFNQAKQLPSQSLLAAYNPNDAVEQQRFYNGRSSNLSSPSGFGNFMSGALGMLTLGRTSFEDRAFYRGQSNIQIASHLLLEDEAGRNQMSNAPGRETKRESEFEIAMNSQLYVLADGWNVGGPAHNIRQVRGMVPANVLDNGVVDGIRNVLGAVLPIARPLRTSQLRFGHIDIEEIPVNTYRTR